MNISNKTLSVLEYDKIIALLASIAPTSGGAELANRLRPTDDIEAVMRRLDKTSDAKRLILSKGMPAFYSIKDITEPIDRAEKGSVLNTIELIDIARVLTCARALSEYLNEDKHFDSSLDENFDRLLVCRSLEDKINRAIISEDMIADEASSELATIRRKIKSANNKVRETLQRLVNSSSYSKYLQENIVTMRNGRYVVPVKVEYRAEIKGLVHDTSASGATIFVEPTGVVDANNELKVLEGKEQKEIERILYELSVECANYSGTIRSNYKNITELSFYFACGQMSVNMNGNAPCVSSKRTLSIIDARHPSIAKEKVVPITVDIKDRYDTMVITGPNTGGKTVTLKTIGLFTLMVQSGLHIPSSELSEISVFDNILADIGDEQSIEQSLSTFSAHMVNIVSILKNVTKRSLVLFDELGAGTDPVEGAALAVSLLEKIREIGAFCAATTHYAELKAFALETDGVVNASCEFDIETLKPTYKLIIGTPGKSNAFAISGKLGLHDDIISRANSLINSDNKRFEYVIEKLEETRMESEKYREELKTAKNEFETYKRESERKINEELKKAKDARDKAEEKARQTIEGARASVSFVLDEIEKLRKKKAAEMSAEELMEAKRKMRRSLDESDEKYNSIEEIDDSDTYVLPRALVKGDNVKLRNIGKTGILTDAPDKDGNCRVKIGSVVTRTNIKNLKLLDDKEIKKKTKNQNNGSVRKSAGSTFKPELDIRGQLGEDGWYLTDKYLDDAIVAGIKSVHIIHGKGTGALRNYLWSCFKTDKRIKSFRLGRYGEGDGGVTVIELN